MFTLLSGLAVACLIAFTITFLVWASKLSEKDSLLVTLLKVVVSWSGSLTGFFGLLALAPHLRYDVDMIVWLMLPFVFIPMLAAFAGSAAGDMWRLWRKDRR